MATFQWSRAKIAVIYANICRQYLLKYCGVKYGKHSSVLGSKQVADLTLWAQHTSYKFFQVVKSSPLWTGSWNTHTHTKGKQVLITNRPPFFFFFGLISGTIHSILAMGMFYNRSWRMNHSTACVKFKYSFVKYSTPVYSPPRCQLSLRRTVLSQSLLRRTPFLHILSGRETKPKAGWAEVSCLKMPKPGKKSEKQNQGWVEIWKCKPDTPSSNQDKPPSQRLFREQSKKIRHGSWMGPSKVAVITIFVNLTTSGINWNLETEGTPGEGLFCLVWSGWFTSSLDL